MKTKISTFSILLIAFALIFNSCKKDDVKDEVQKIVETLIPNSFTVDGGLGYLNVDLSGWETSTEQISGFPYKVWTKKDTYSSALPHQINFTLSQ